jgi:hypothetical protein
MSINNKGYQLKGFVIKESSRVWFQEEAGGNDLPYPFTQPQEMSLCPHLGHLSM